MANFLAGACLVYAMWCAEDGDYRHASAFLFLALILFIGEIGK